MQADQKKKAVDLEQSARTPAEGSSSQAKQRSDVQSARQRDAKKRRKQRASEAAASSSSWHPRPVPSGAKVYRRRIPPPVAKASSPELPQELPSDPRHSSSEPGFGIPKLSGLSSVPIIFPIPTSDSLDSSRRDLLPLSVLLAQYEKQFPPLQTPCTFSIRRSDTIKTKT